MGLGLVAAHELPESGDALLDAGEAAVGERARDLVLLEHALAAAGAENAVDGAQRGRSRAAGREQSDATARREYAVHAVQRRPGIVEHVEGGEAADRVEALVAERQLHRVA